jgi:hypothetical protein
MPLFSHATKSCACRQSVLMKTNRAKFMKFLIAILLGNGLYFALSPQLPPAARHRAWTIDLGTIVDFWFCLLVYGLLELGSFLRTRQPVKPPRD